MSVAVFQLPPNSSGSQVNGVTAVIGGATVVTPAGVIADGIAPGSNIASVNSPISGVAVRLFELAVSSAPVDGQKATYSAAVTGLLPTAAASTGLVILTGSATKTVRLTHVLISASIATTAVYIDWQVAKYSAAATGGTSTAMTAVPYDSNSAAATASAASYTGAGPTLGTLVGVIANAKMIAPVTATPAISNIIEFNFGNRPAGAPVLRGIAQQIAITANSVTFGTAPNIDITLEWTEE
jgi:hypothetical protein